MATYRIGIGSFNLKDGAVGIGTEATGLGNLKVEGTYKTTDLDVTGVSTFTRYAGFAANDINIKNRDVTLTGEHQTTGDIVVGVNSTFTVSVGATVDVGTVPSVSIGTHFSPPTGDINDRPEVPVEGTVRFNRDLNTLEFYNGVDWRQFTVSGASGRGFWIGGYDQQSLIIDYVNIQTQGNATNFGELLSTSVGSGNNGSMCCGNEIRGLIGGGNGPSGQCPYIQYITTASKGDAINFGNLFQTRFRGSGLSSSTRGLFGAGRTPGAVNTVDYVEIMTLGNAQDFGDLINATRTPGSVSSPTRGLFAGGQTGTEISAVNIASKGNATRFGEDLFDGGYTHGGGSTGVRGIWAGGYSVPSGSPYPINRHTRSIRGVIIASDGNAVEFGELQRSLGLTYVAGLSDKTRACWGGGYVLSPTADLNTIEYFQMNSSGNAMDFGDLTQSRSLLGSLSDSHGGLGGY